MQQQFSYVIDTLSSIAQLLLLAGENEFRARAYEQAVRLIEAQASDFEGLLERLRQGKAPGFGPQIAPLVVSLAAGHPAELLQELEQQIPQGVRDLLEVPGLGPKKVRFLWQQAQISSVAALLRACEQQQIRECKGFGAKTEEKLLQLLPGLIEDRRKLRLDQAEELAARLSDAIVAAGIASSWQISGELRRGCKVIHELVLVLQASQPVEEKQLRACCSELAQLESHSACESVLRSARAFPIRLRWVDTPERACLSLFESTGPEEFVAPLMLKLAALDAEASVTEERLLFSRLEIPYLPPECREQAQAINSDPLIEASDVRGILHCHSTWSDGQASLREMALATRARGFEYLGISDHSRSAAYANGLPVERVLQQQREVEALNTELSPFRIFWGIESDILADGSLDYEPEILERFDFVIASVHSRFSMSRDEMTRRIVNAVKNPYTSILGHPSGRLLLRRGAYELDLAEVIKVAGAEGKAIECNCDPHRLDLDSNFHQMARQQGVLIPLSPDAHSTESLDYLRYGLMQARRARLGKGDVLNCRGVAELQSWFRARVR
jgi:DNA polymerase (family 10)